MRHGRLTQVRVARAVGKEESVKIECIEIIVPGHAHHIHPPFQQAAQDIGLYAAVHQHHALARCSSLRRLVLGQTVGRLAVIRCAVVHDLPARHLRHKVHTLVCAETGILAVLAVHHDASHHHAVLAQYFGELSCVDARYSGHMLPFEPLRQRFAGVPVAILPAVVAHDDSACIDAVAFHVVGQAVGLEGERRHTIIPHQWVGEHHQLACIRGVGQALGVTRHGRIEHHFSACGSLIAEGKAGEGGAIL